jgi:hypothetical protein
MRCITASHAVTQYSGSISEMMPHFIMIAVVVAVVVAALVIYTKVKK